MRRLWTLILLVGLSGLGLQLAAQQQQPNDQPSAQQPSTQPPSAQEPSTQPPSAQQPSQSGDQPGAQQPTQPNAQPPQPPTDQPSSQPTDATNKQSAQTMQGKITRAGNQLIFQEGSSQTAFQLDDQSKAAPFEGKNVKMMATIDPKTNTLHVIDIGPSEK